MVACHFRWIFLLVSSFVPAPMRCIAQESSRTGSSGTKSAQSELVDWLTDLIVSEDTSDLSQHQSNYFRSVAAEHLFALGKKDEALRFWNDAFETLKSTPKSSAHFTLLRAADKLDRLDLMEKVIEIGGSMQNELRDQLKIAKYRRGELDALQNYPTSGETMTFYDAMDLAKLYIDEHDYQKAETLVVGIEITEENDPRAVTALCFEDIAQRELAAGNRESAETYIDRAHEIGGRLFYTGYALEVSHRAIHGRLTDGLDKLARRGAAYRGHQGRELIQVLVSALTEAKLYAEAEKVAKQHLESPQDIETCLARIVSHRAEQGDYRGALGMVKTMGSSPSQNHSRIMIAESLAKAGNADATVEIADFIEGSLAELDPVNPDRLRLLKGLVRLGIALRDTPRVIRQINATQEPYELAQLLLEALQSVVELEVSEAARR